MIWKKIEVVSKSKVNWLEITLPILTYISRKKWWSIIGREGLFLYAFFDKVTILILYFCIVLENLLLYIIYGIKLFFLFQHFLESF